MPAAASKPPTKLPNRNKRLLHLTRASAPLRCTLWWCAGLELEPGVAGLLPNRDRGRGKTRICEVADGDGNVTGKALALHVYRGAAGRAEVEGDRVAVLGRARPAKVICSRRKLAWLLMTAPVRRWHSRQ
jgi:hypothetical protein